AAVVPPVLVYAIARLLGDAVPRLLLFNAAVIASSWVGGLEAGLAATILSAGLAWSLMVPRFGPVQPRFYVATAMFAPGAVAISVFHARLRRATRDAGEALARSQRATADLTRVRWELESANVRLQRTTDDLNRSKGLLQAVFDHTPTVIVVKD